MLKMRREELTGQSVCSFMIGLCQHINKTAVHLMEAYRAISEIVRSTVCFLLYSEGEPEFGFSTFSQEQKRLEPLEICLQILTQYTAVCTYTRLYTKP